MKLAALTCFFVLSATVARAEDFTPQAGDTIARVGAADIMFAAGAKISLAGQRVPDASLKQSDNVTAATELGYYVTRNVSLTLTVGVPPTTRGTGVGALSGVGHLGSVEYGPAAALVNYNFAHLGRFQPWVGAGATYLLVFANKDAAIQHLSVEDHLGAAVEAGGEYRLNRRWGVYASVSKLFLHTNGRGSFQSLPISAKIDLNPLIVQSGVTLHFR